MAQIILPTGAVPATPTAGNVTVYAKTDGFIYGKDSAGVETPLSAVATASAITNTPAGNIAATTVQAAINELDDERFGVGQTWQNVAGSRAIGTTYTNATGKPIAISISARTSADADFWLFVNGTEIAVTTLTAATIDGVHSTIVPSGSTYKVTLAGSTTIHFWWELR